MILVSKDAMWINIVKMKHKIVVFILEDITEILIRKDIQKWKMV